MPEMGTMQQINSEPLHMGTMHQLNPEPLHIGTILTPQSQAEQYAREAKEAAAEAAQSATDAQTAAESAQQAVAGAVKYSEAQTLTAAQQAQARENIGAASGDAPAAPAIIASAGPADIVSITDGAEDAPVKSLVVGIEPVQDLHGYDNPWPAGGGKNIAKFAEDILSADRSQNGITFHALNENFVRISGSAEGTAYLTSPQTYQKLVDEGRFYKAGTYVLSSNLPRKNGCTVYMTGYEADGTSIAGNVVTGVYEGRSVSFTRNSDFYANIQMSIGSGSDFTTPVDVFVQIESGSTATDYVPYSNICPISGFDGLTVQRTGKNLLDPTKKRYTQSNMYFYYNDGLLLNAGTYIISYKGPETMSGIYVSHYPADSSTVAFKYNTKSLTFTVQKQTRVIFNYYLAGGAALPDDVTQYQLEVGSSATDYEPYQGETYSISFPSEAGTVYGGSLTIAEDGSGVLTVDRAMVDLGTLKYGYNATYKVFSAYKGDIKQHGYCVSSQYKYGDGVSAPDMSCCLGYGGWFVNNVCIKDSRYSIPEDFKAAMSGVQLVYELATPVTYTLTASQITTLLGTNNIWADTGDTTVEYTADTKMYIDSQTRATRSLIAGIETTMTASRAYAAGDLLIVGDTLYKAAASIASGATLTPGTNVTPTTVAEQLILLANA